MALSRLKAKLQSTYDDSLNSTVRGSKLAIFLIAYKSLICTLLLGVTPASQINPFLQGGLSMLAKVMLMWVHFDPLASDIFLAGVAGYWLVTVLLHVVCCVTGRLLPVLRLNAEICKCVLFIPFVCGLSLKAYLNITKSSATSFFSLFLLILTILYYILIQLLLFNFSMTSNDAFRRCPRTRYYLKPLLQTLLIFVFLINYLSVVSGLFNVVVFSLLLLNICSLYEAVFEMVDYCAVVSKARIFAILLSMSLAIWDALGYNMNVQLITQNYLVVSLVFYGFLVVLLLNYRNYSVKSLRIEHIDNIHNSTQFLIKFRANFELFLKYKTRKSLMMRSSVIQSHTRDCTDIDCSCRTRQKLYDPTTKQWGNPNVAAHNDTVFCKFHLKTLFLQGMSKFREQKLIHHTYMYFTWDTFKLYTKIPELIAHFENTFSNVSNLGDQQLILHLRRKVLEDMSERRRGEPTVPVEDIEKFDKSFNGLYERITYLVELYQMMWKTTIEPVVDKGVLLKVCEEITERKVMVKRLYEECVMYNKRSKPLMVHMYLYCFKIAFDGWLGKRIKTQIQTVGQNQSKQSVYHISNIFCGDSQTCTLKVSASQQDIGLVQWVSSNFTQLYGYRRDEIAGKKVNLLMPPIFSKNHDTWMKNWKEKGTEFNMNRTRRFWIIDKKGHCSSSHSYIKIVPMLTHFELVGLLRKNNQQDYILLNHKTGVIESTGKRFSDLILQTDPITLLHTKIEFQVFSPELMNMFKTNKFENSQTLSVHLLVPNHTEDFLHKYAAEKELINSFSTTTPAEILQQKVSELITQQISDLITQADNLARIFMLNLLIQKVDTTHGQTFYSIKITQMQQVNKLTPLLRSLQTTIKQQTYARLQSLKGERKNRLDLAVDIFRKMLDCKRSDMLSRSSYMRLNGMSRKKSEKGVGMVESRTAVQVNNRTSILRMSKKRDSNGAVNMQDRISTKEFGVSRRKSCQNTLSRIKDVLRREDILGRSHFSSFFSKKMLPVGPLRMQTLTPSNSKHSGQLTLSNTIQMCSKNGAKPEQIQQSFQTKQDNNGLELLSAASAKTGCSTQINFQQLRKRSISTQPHRSLSIYKALLLCIFLLYTLLRLLSILFTNAIEPQLARMLSSQAESSQVIVMLELFYHSALVINTTMVLAPEHVKPLAETIGSGSQYVTELINEHINGKMDKTIIDDEYYGYLDMHMDAEVGQQTEHVSGLQVIKMFQMNLIDIIGNEQLERYLKLLRANYPTIQTMLRSSTRTYNLNITELLDMFRTCLIIRIVCNLTLIIVMFLTILSLLAKVQSWLCQCMQMMASTPVEISSGCIAYYKRIKEEMKEPGGKYVATDLESYVQGSVSYRTPHTKGTLVPWWRNVLLLVVVAFCLNQLTSYNSFKLCDYYTGFSGFNELMAQSQAGLIQASIKLHQDYLSNRTDYPTFNISYLPSLTLYHSLIQSSFQRLSPLSENTALTNLLKSDVCTRFTSPVEISYPNCSKITINSYGLPLLVQSVVNSIFRMYGVLVQSTSRFEIQLVRPMEMNNQYGMYYAYNGWVWMWRTIKENLQVNLRVGLEWSNFAEGIGYVVFVAVMYAIAMAYRHSARSVNRIGSYVMVIPRQLAADNQYLKHFLRRFL